MFFWNKLLQQNYCLHKRKIFTIDDIAFKKKQMHSGWWGLSGETIWFVRFTTYSFFVWDFLLSHPLPIPQCTAKSWNASIVCLYDLLFSSAMKSWEPESRAVYYLPCAHSLLFLVVYTHINNTIDRTVISYSRGMDLDTNLFYIFFYSYFEEIKD